MKVNVGLRIRKFREDLGLTQEELAERLGYASRSSVNKVENAEEISLKKVDKFAKALGTDTPTLLGWNDESDADSQKGKSDDAFTDLPDRIKDYALKLSKLPIEKQEQIMSLIDMLGNK